MNSTTASLDRALVDRLLEGDGAAFDQFFSDYYPKLFRFALRRLHPDSHAAEDLAQATICEALKSLHTYRGEASLMTWLCTLCRRQLSARMREARSFASGMALREDDPEIRAALESLLAPERDDPVQARSLAEIQEAVIVALDHLPANYAQILEWKYVHDLSVAEIAGRMGRTAKATESLLTRAREAFRDAFSSLGSDSLTARSSA